MDYRSVIESKYNRQNWQALLYDIFRNKVQFWQQPQPVPVDKDMARSALYTGKITLPDGHVIAIYEVELSESVIIERNRAGIRNLLLSSWRGMGCSGAFMFCFRQNEAVLRFSYVSESFAFAEDGSLTKESTDTKRFTYLLGEGHRSRTAIMQFEDLKKSALDLKAITKAFSVEALSDLFFKEYKKQYEDIIEFITGKRMVKVANKWEEQVTGQPCREIMQEFSQFSDAEKAVRDYVKKLMGRLVFIQFLQKKGWMGCSAGESWNDGDKEFVQNLFANTTHKNTFVDDVLEPLFNDINTKRTGDITSSPNVGTGIKIPYLNGGLFEKDDYDKTNFQLPAKYMKNLLDFFASYNFTIDENDPDDAEIGVDPEMLGRIFENLLEDNKDKGAFYTPKEIVQYMCRESLIAYLQTDVNDDQTKDAIRQFVTTYDASILSEELKESVDQKLKDVKICDPAIGSGAFPMGLLRELYACRKAIEGIDEETAVSIKTHIIQNNIYGVDIEKGAVDIARLRFWLALIVDEKNPHALPNMDFKIMQGNSLLEQYEGVELSGMSLDEQKKRKTKKGQAWQATFAFDEQDALDNIQHAIKEYYLTDDQTSKSNLRRIINENVRSYIVNLKGCTSEIQTKIAKLPIPNDQFFLWHIYFKEVFDNGGFDIVIGNPPYLFLSGKGSPVQRMRNEGKYEKAECLQNLFDTYAEVYPEVSRGCRDFYKWFYKLAINIANSGGIVSYITPDTFFNMPKYRDLREQIFSNEALYMYDLGFSVFDAPTVSTGISLLRKDSTSDNVDYSDIKMLLTKGNRYMLQSLIENNKINVPISDSEMAAYKHPLASKLYNSSSCLPARTYLRFIEGEHGIHIDTNELYETKGHGLVPVLVDAMLERNGFVPMYYIESDCPISEIHKGERGILRKTGDTIVCSVPLSDAPAIAHQNVYVVRPLDTKFPMTMWMAILNSKLLTFLYQNGLFGQKGRTMAQFRVYALDALPMPAKLNNSICRKIENLITNVLNNKDEKTSYEHEIDLLVYELYGLTEAEIKIVEGTK